MMDQAGRLAAPSLQSSADAASPRRRASGSRPVQPPSHQGSPRGRRWLAAWTAASCWLAGCSSGSTDQTGPGAGANDFAVSSSTVSTGAERPLNQSIEITFNEDVDFSTVSLSTIQIVEGQGEPAAGSFTQPMPRVIRFQPACPDNDDNTNGGFLQGGAYRLIVRSELDGGLTVQNTAGQGLVAGLDVAFATPQSNDPADLFIDGAAGPPAIRVRGLNGEALDSLDGSYIEFPGRSAPEDRSYLEFDTSLQQGRLPGGELVPLNLYSDAAEQFAVVLQFNQSVFGGASNINSQRIGLEYLDIDPATSMESWRPVPSSVSLVSNCTSVGAAVRVVPGGVMPQGSEIRAVVREGFSDLTGDALQVALTDLARLSSGLADPTGPDAGSRDDGADEILELFTVGGDAEGSREDTKTGSLYPRGDWSSDAAPGVLEATVNFGGTGGPNGDFDWIISANETFILSTDADTIVGGPNGVPSAQQPVIGGVVNVRNLVVEAGANLTIIGSNTATILATGSVVIRGSVRLDGGDSPGVSTLNTANEPTPGARGGPGGGMGGTGSANVDSSTPRGGPGFGAFNVPGGGGQGGETGYAPGTLCGKENRRGAGGGGGRFGRDVRYLFNGNLVRSQTLVGMDAEPGFVGSLDGTGAVSQNAPAQGGAVGPTPFVDGDNTNDFFGTAFLASGEQVRGELASVWGGSGGGGGGDAVNSAVFPLTPFSPTADEVGGGGGGGAGGLEILAVGDVRLLGDGVISADGGTGGGGENTSFFDRVGGGAGGGSGGHIVIASGGNIIIESEVSGDVVGPFYSDVTVNPVGAAFVHEKRPLRALGGQGGAGREDFCGAGSSGETGWSADAIPFEAFEGDVTIPPQSVQSWLTLCNRVAPCATTPPEGTTVGAGGDGGPGIIQLHVTDPETQIQFPNRPGVYGGQPDPADPSQVINSVDPTFSMVPPPFGWLTPTAPVDRMVPFFSTRSESFSKWIPLGLARTNPGTLADEQVLLFFGGTDPTTGEVLRDGLTSQEPAPLVPFTSISAGGALPSGDADLSTVTFDGGTIDGLYRTNPALMREFALRLRDLSFPDGVEEFIVQSASYDEGADRFTVVVDPRGDDFRNQLAGTLPEVELVPFFFRVQAGGLKDLYPANTSIRILFDAAVVDGATGEPSIQPADIFSGGDVRSFTADISELNSQAWDFIRVKFEFDIKVDGQPLSAGDLGLPRPGLDYFRIPYTF